MNIVESLRKNDLQNVLSDTVYINMHSSNIDETAVVVVLGMYEESALSDFDDFFQGAGIPFIETKYDDFPDIDGKYLMYISFDRENIDNSIQSFFTDLYIVSGLEKFKVVYFNENTKREETQYANDQTIKGIVKSIIKK